jgi:hypothetical protein
MAHAVVNSNRFRRNVRDSGLRACTGHGCLLLTGTASEKLNEIRLKFVQCFKP